MKNVNKHLYYLLQGSVTTKEEKLQNMKELDDEDGRCVAFSFKMKYASSKTQEVIETTSVRKLKLKDQ